MAKYRVINSSMGYHGHVGEGEPVGHSMIKVTFPDGMFYQYYDTEVELVEEAPEVDEKYRVIERNYTHYGMIGTRVVTDDDAGYIRLMFEDSTGLFTSDEIELVEPDPNEIEAYQIRKGDLIRWEGEYDRFHEVVYTAGWDGNAFHEEGHFFLLKREEPETMVVAKHEYDALLAALALLGGSSDLAGYRRLFKAVLELDVATKALDR